VTELDVGGRILLKWTDQSVQYIYIYSISMGAGIEQSI
jgi:hypothetical protein